MNIRNIIGMTAAAVILTACHSKSSEKGDNHGSPAKTAVSDESQETKSDGIVMQDFNMPDINGNNVSFLAEVAKNRLTLVDFWASWCGPCRQEMPNVVKIYSEYHNKGLGIIGISLDEDREAWADAVEQMNMTWTQLSDLQGWDNAAAQMYGVQSIPFTLLVDRDGNLLQSGLRGEQLHKTIARYLEE